MRGDLLDVVLLVFAAAFAYSGYRRGFITGALALAGFAAGAVVGIVIGPPIASRFADGPGRTLIALVAVIVLASLGQFVGTIVGATLRGHITWKPARVVDSIGGGIISAVGVLTLAWFLGTAVANSHYVGLSRQVRRSQVIAVLDKLMPNGRTMFSRFFRLFEDRGFPQVFSGLSPENSPNVPPPDPAVANLPVVRAARDRVLKITGVANSCSRSLEGTGFVYAVDHIMTNAHVVAGIRRPIVHLANGDQKEATVVLYDSDRDVAVLYVRGLSLRPLAFDGEAKQGESAIVVGYPENGPYTPVSARVRQKITAKGPDIYERHTVTRDVYALRTRVRPGNSGGPMLKPNGQVYGVVFAAAASDPDTGYALTAAEVASDASAGASRTEAVSTQGCD